MPADSSRIEILQVAPLLPSVEKGLAHAYTVHRLPAFAEQSAFLAPIAARIRGVATSGFVGVSREILSQLPKLEIVSCFGVGVDAVDTAYCRERGIAVGNTPDVLTDAVADLALNLTLSALRRTPQAERYLRQGDWAARKPVPLADDIGGKVMGVLGLGRIGLAIAKRAEAFGVKIVYHGPREKPGIGYRYYADLERMAKECDILMIACPGGRETDKIVNAAVLAALGPKGYVVNIARGSVVDEPALVQALAQGRLKGAGLDVFAQEPNVPGELLALDNVVLLPHIGSATVSTREAMGDLVLRNFAAFFAGEKMPARFV